MGQKYLGSVRFFKHLIILALVLLILTPIFFTYHLYKRVNVLDQEINILNQQLYILEKKIDFLTLSKATKSPNIEKRKVNVLTLSRPLKPLVVKKKTVNVLVASKSLKPKITKRKGASATKKIVYLTFDDGPSVITDKILDVLKAKNVKATFFVVHHSEPQTIERLKRIIKEGHAIGLHSYSHHAEQIYSSVKSFTDDIDKLSAFIKQNTGYEAKILRFPGGSNNQYLSKDLFVQLKSEMNKRGYVYFDWNVSLNDGVNPSSLKLNSILNNCNAMLKQRGVAIILMHDSPQNKMHLVEALPLIIDNLRKNGYTFSVLSPNVRQIAFRK